MGWGVECTPPHNFKNKTGANIKNYRVPVAVKIC